MRICCILLSFIMLSAKTACAGTTMQGLSKTVQYVQMDKIEEQRKEAEKASQKGLSSERIAEIKTQADGVSSSAIEKLVSIRNAVMEQRAFKDEILLHLSLNKRHGNLLTDFDVIQLKRYAEDGRFREAVKYMDGIIEARASSPITTEERLAILANNWDKRDFVQTEVNRWISELIHDEVNSGKDHTQLIMHLQRVKADSIGASVYCYSEVIK